MRIDSSSNCKTNKRWNYYIKYYNIVISFNTTSGKSANLCLVVSTFRLIIISNSIRHRVYVSACSAVHEPRKCQQELKVMDDRRFVSYFDSLFSRSVQGFRFDFWCHGRNPFNNLSSRSKLVDMGEYSYLSSLSKIGMLRALKHTVHCL